MKPTTCSSCGAKIVWVSIKGKAIPLNWRRVRAYVQSAGGMIRELNHTDLEPTRPSKPCLVRVSHFLTCPKATIISDCRG